MEEADIQSMSNTLSTQPLTLGEPSNDPPAQTTTDDLLVDPQLSPATDPTASPETPAKRRPGRPKGSGKKAIDMSSPESRSKRPVGRPRKDGLPAGSVGPKRPGRPRKRPPGSFATGSGSNRQSPVLMPYSAPPFADAAQWHPSMSVPPMASLSRAPPPMAFPIDPSLDRDNWPDLSRHRPDAFLHALVTALSSPHPVSTAGPSVEEAFKAHLVSLAPNGKNASPAIPSLYSVLKTFWLPSSPAYFSLTASASTTRTPSEHRFLYWDPQPLVFNGIACPACSAPLVNQGRIVSGPIKIYDLGKPFFIIGCEYACRSQVCLPPGTPGDGRKFASTDVSILRSLPPKLRDEFPARLIQNAGPTPDLGSAADVWSWRGMGISSALWNMVRACLRHGLQKDAVLNIVQNVVDGTSEEFWVPQQQMSVTPLKRKSDAAEEEEGDGDGEEDDEADEDEQNDATPALEKSAVEEFHEAWNANNGAGPSNAVPETGPNDPNGAPPPLGPPPPEYGHPFAQQHPYLPYGYPPYGYYPPPPPAQSLKRTFALVDGGDDTPLHGPVHKRVRHCVKCGSNECKGKGGRAFCTNPCQDCGKLECKGRNSKRPDRTCADAW
ncbi:hypothetical protein EW026_g5592 [Hermanssonia centrifuga]|uniref:Uncharacterized protein n=1 Tax=Hermanssonia centrifuga TaxID=98765 RepID=A0A4S4KEQ6_9APHY|nr:hypothetical protein EW026_g5592 [Hermanssonia centrifuga]